MDPTVRFSDRVENYESYRPRYPDGVLQILRQETSLSPLSLVADIGSGTGLSSELFLENGNTVFAVEPNRHMRQAAERRLERYAGFHSVSATAEATSLPDRSIDYVVAGQSFHWFDAPLAKREFARVLRPRGWVVLLWNTRRLDSTPFLAAYEALLQRFGTDYREVKHRHIDLSTLSAFFSDGSFCRRTLYNEQRLTLRELQGRLLSSSYTPTATHPTHEPMLRELERIFRAYNEAGVVRLEYDVEIYFGHMTQLRGD
jgi:SAM-dependent methyltransferase